LIALLDDVAALAKVAAASIDDAALYAGKASAKAAGVVIDDAAVTPTYVVGFTADRELPIIWRIAKGSLRNKLLILLPAALALSWIAPWAITPLLAIGGAYLCYEGAEKVYEALRPAQAEHHGPHGGPAEKDPAALEQEMVSGAVRTDFILSAEIMFIALAAVEETTFATRAAVLALVGVGITAVVYGAVALIVKADDAGLALARRGGAARAVGGLLVHGMPKLLKALSVIGTAAMLWVGGGIVVHGLEEAGLDAIGHGIHAAAEAAAHAVSGFEGAIAWLVSAAGAGLFGLLLGALLVVAHHKLVPHKAH
jgi:predicted DNA repair protein MutK